MTNLWVVVTYLGPWLERDDRPPSSCSIGVNVGYSPGVVGKLTRVNFGVYAR
jgi:hypothetical protein